MRSRYSAPIDPNDRFTQTIKGLAQRVAELERAAGIVRVPNQAILFHSLGFSGTTSGTTPFLASSVTVPAQGVLGAVLVIVHAYVSFSTSGDGFECFITESDNPTAQIASTRINVPTAPKDPTVSPHAHFLSDGTDSETYEFRVLRTVGTGTATVFSDFRYNRITALWVPT